jgi:hypothetical protein
MYGDVFGGSLAAIVRSAFALPDPRLKDAGPKALDAGANFLFNRDSNAKPTPLPPQPGQPRVQLPNANALDSITAKASAASRSIDQIGPRAQASLGTAVRAVQNFNNNPASFDGTRTKAGQASRSLDLIGNSASRNSAVAVGAVNRVKGAMDGVKGKDVKLGVDAGQALSAARALAAEINSLHDRTIRLTTVRASGGHSVAGNAAGGWISGPGTGTSDSIPRWLSNGEFVVNAAAASANRAWLEQINASGRSYQPGRYTPRSHAAAAPVHVTVSGHIDEHGYVTATANDVYGQNQDFQMSNLP